MEINNNAVIQGPNIAPAEASFYFSPSENVFLAAVMKKAYVIAGTWPGDPQPVSDDAFKKFSAPPPDGMTRGADENGFPCWNNLPPPSKEELAARARNKKERILRQAEIRIAPLERAMRLGMANEQEKTLLTQWETYSVLVSRIDVDAQNIAWPESPDVA